MLFKAYLNLAFTGFILFSFLMPATTLNRGHDKEFNDFREVLLPLF